MGGYGGSPAAVDLSVPAVKRPLLSIVVVLFGAGWRWLPQAVRALVQNTEPCYELILVDNGGKDQGDVRGARLVRSQGNVGFAAGSRTSWPRPRHG